MAKLYQEREQCIFCNCSEFETLLEDNYKAPITNILSFDLKENYFMPYNIICCNNCNTCQNKYLADVQLVYDGAHNDNYGLVKNEKFNKMYNFITSNEKINGIIEIGACHNFLAEKIIDTMKIPYTIIEVNNIKKNENINYINNFFENVDIIDINANTLIMSDVFEHFYNPTEIIKKIYDSQIQYIYINHPDFDYAINNNLLMCLNTEHTFLIEHQFLFSLFENNGFRLKCLQNFENFSLLLLFERIDYSFSKMINNNLLNINTKNNVNKYINNMKRTATYINNIMNETPNKNYYIWPASVHSITLFMFNLNYKKLTGVLDNSPNKIGKYLQCYSLLCSSFNEILNSNDENTTIIISGAGNYINELNISKSKIKFIFVNSIQ